MRTLRRSPPPPPPPNSLCVWAGGFHSKHDSVLDSLSVLNCPPPSPPCIPPLPSRGPLPSPIGRKCTFNHERASDKKELYQQRQQKCWTKCTEMCPPHSLDPKSSIVKEPNGIYLYIAQDWRQQRLGAETFGIYVSTVDIIVPINLKIYGKQG